MCCQAPLPQRKSAAREMPRRPCVSTRRRGLPFSPRPRAFGPPGWRKRPRPAPQRPRRQDHPSRHVDNEQRGRARRQLTQTGGDGPGRDRQGAKCGRASVYRLLEAAMAVPQRSGPAWGRLATRMMREKMLPALAGCCGRLLSGNGGLRTDGLGGGFLRCRFLHECFPSASLEKRTYEFAAENHSGHARTNSRIAEACSAY